MAVPERDELVFEDENAVEEGSEEAAEPQEATLEEELTKQINDIFGMVSKEEGGEAASDSTPAPTPTYDQMSQEQRKELKQQTGMSEKELKEWVNENALNDPFDSYKAFYEKGVKPQIAGAFSQMLDLVIDLSKDRLANDPSTATVWKKYKKEIEREVEKTPAQQRYADPKNLWRNAALTVKGRHSDDLQQEFAKEKVDELLPYLKEKLGLGVKGAGAAPNYAETNNASAPKRKKVKVKTSAALKQQLEKEAYSRGMSYEKYAEVQYRKNPGRFN